MVRYLQITGWQKHRGHHTRWASVRLNTALIVSLFWQSLFLSHNQSQCSLHSHCCDYLHTSYYLPGITSSRKHVKYINSSIFVLLTLKGAVCKVMVILTSLYCVNDVFNDSVLSRLLFQCTDVVFRWVFFVGASQQLTWWSVWTQHEPRKDSQLTSSSLPISQPSCQTNQSFNPLRNTAAT